MWEVMVFMCGLLPDAATAVGVMGLCIQVRDVSLRQTRQLLHTYSILASRQAAAASTHER